MKQTLGNHRYFKVKVWPLIMTDLCVLSSRVSLGLILQEQKRRLAVGALCVCFGS